jgi:hypothetical protein
MFMGTRFSGKARVDVKLGLYNLMRVIFINGEKYLLAHMNLTYVISDRDCQQYTSFDPTRHGYIHWPIAGSYVSQMKETSSNMILCRDLNKTSQSQDVLDMVKLATYHDFMALLAVSYRTSISAGLTLVDARHSAVNTLVRFLRSMHHALIHDIIRIMICIAKTVMPAPSAPLLLPLQQQRRLSIAVISAPPAGYMPQSSSEENEDGEESTAHNEPDYEEERYSTHSTPVSQCAPSRAEAANIEPRRITHLSSTHPRARSPTGPSPIRAAFSERSPPGVKARSPAVRLPIRSPAQGSLKRKATTPQQYLRNAVEHSPVSPLKAPKLRKVTSAPIKASTKSPAKSPLQSPDHSPAKSSADSSSSSVPHNPTSPQLESIDDPSLSDDQMSLNFFQIHTAAVSLMSKKSQNKIIIDSGASTCGTGIKSQLQNIRPTSLTVSAVFGTTAQPTEMGDLPPYMLPTIIIDEMADTTLLSVSQACCENMCGIFTAVDCRFYTLSSILLFLKLISESGEETMRGAVEYGLYVQESN